MWNGRIVVLMDDSTEAPRRSSRAAHDRAQATPSVRRPSEWRSCSARDHGGRRDPVYDGRPLRLPFGADCSAARASAPDERVIVFPGGGEREGSDPRARARSDPAARPRARPPELPGGPTSPVIAPRRNAFLRRRFSLPSFPSLLAIALYLKTRPAPPAPPPEPAPAARSPRPTAPRAGTAPPTAAPTKSARELIRGRSTRLAAIVIDDLGNELGPAERIATWKWPVAGAVFPGVAYSAAAARALARGGKEVLLHLPMEPAGFPKVRPGPGVILRAQSRRRDRARRSRPISRPSPGRRA